MANEDSNTFTQKDLMQHLLHASQHVATREELQTVKQEIVADIDKRFEQVDKRFEQVDKRFEQVDRRFDELRSEIKAQGAELRSDIKEQGRRHDRLSWAIFAAMFAVFFKDQIVTLFSWFLNFVSPREDVPEKNEREKRGAILR